MVGGLKVLTVIPGREREFEELFAELRNEMRRHEPGCLLYSLLKSRKEPSSYIVHEQYVDQAALDTHTTSPHGVRYFPRIRALLTHIDVEYFDGVVGWLP
jgi:quinol monooxygenase YgiN